MSVRRHLYRNVSALAILLALLPGGVFTSSSLAAQRRDRRERQPSDTVQVPSRKNEKGPRAIAVIEWQTDARGRATPKLVPILIQDNGRLHDAGLYRATPVPMALESGTVYEAQDGGEILGYFTIKGAVRANAQSSATDSDSSTDDRPWLGLGDWKSAAPPLDLFTNRPQHAEVLRPGRGSSDQNVADSNESNSSNDGSGSTRQKATVYNEEGKEVPQGANDGRPTLKRRSKDREGTPRVAPPEAKKADPSDDPDRPRLKRQTSDSGGSGQSSPPSSTANSAPQSSESSSPQSKTESAAAETSSSAGVDSDRPVLRRGAGSEQVKTDSESAAASDRPVLKRGGGGSSGSAKSTSSGVSNKKSDSGRTALGPTVPQRVIDRGTREPDESKSVSLRTRTYEAVAISDARVPENPPVYKHRWEGDEEQEVTRKMTALAETEAQNFKRARASGVASASRPPAAPATGVKIQRRAGASPRADGTGSGAQGESARQQLEDVRVFALDISSNNSAEIVFTARQRQPGSRWLYVTMVARMDLTGNPRKLFASVTTSDRLDSIPRLEFIDAVDIDGDGRAELLFRAMNGGDAEFLVYRVGPDKLTEIFHGGRA